jgi:hypothetical protein
MNTTIKRWYPKIVDLLKHGSIEQRRAADPWIETYEAAYLKKSGAKLGVKVSIDIVDRGNGWRPVIHMRDFEFKTFKDATRFLRYVATTDFHEVAS